MIVANAASGCIVLREMDEVSLTPTPTLTPNLILTHPQAPAWQFGCYALCIIIVVFGLVVLVSGEEPVPPTPLSTPSGTPSHSITPSHVIHSTRGPLLHHAASSVLSGEGLASLENSIATNTPSFRARSVRMDDISSMHGGLDDASEATTEPGTPLSDSPGTSPLSSSGVQVEFSSKADTKVDVAAAMVPGVRGDVNVSKAGLYLKDGS